MNANLSILRALSATLATFVIGSVATPAHAAEPTPGGPGEDTRQLDEHLKRYWGNEMREVNVLQKRLYRKEDRAEFELMAGIIPNDEFYTYYPLGLRADYFFAEDFGAELWGSYLIRVNSELADFLETNFENQFIVNVTQSLQWLAGANFLWSPFHGKIGFFTEKLAHFDMHAAFGVGVIGTTVRDLSNESTKIDVAGNVGLGLRFFLSDSIALRFDYRQYFYAAEAGGLAHPVELTLGVSFFTSAPE